MFRIPKLYLSLVALIAAMAVFPAASSASQFNWSVAAQYNTHALGTQEITFNKGQSVKCNQANGVGAVNSSNWSEFYLTVTYSGCSYHEGGAESIAEVSPAKYRYSADGYLDLLQPLTIHGFTGFSECDITVAAKNGVASVGYVNLAGTMEVNNAAQGLAYSSVASLPGFMCPGSGTNGAIIGSSEMVLYGGTVSWQK